MTGAEWPVFVISLPDCAARRAPLLATLDRLGLAAELVPAIDGRAGLPPEAEGLVDRAAARRALGRDMTDAELGCALSHQQVYGLIEQRGLPGALVLEDDARPRPALAELLSALRPGEAELWLLSYGAARVMLGSRRELLPGIATLELALNAPLAAGYLISRRAAALLRRAGQPVRHPADWPADITRLGARIVTPRLVEHPDGAVVPSLLDAGRRAAEHGMRHPKLRPSRFATTAYWRRWWRKRRSVWLPA